MAERSLRFSQVTRRRLIELVTRPRACAVSQACTVWRPKPNGISINFPGQVYTTPAPISSGAPGGVRYCHSRYYLAMPFKKSPYDSALIVRTCRMVC